MVKKYDLVIVGAGPAGAMAAKVAGENGLKTAILERKTNPAKITRGCANMFVAEEGAFAEKMYYHKTKKKIIFPVNGFSVDYVGPTRNFYAWHFYAPDGKTRLEFGDYEENIKKGDKGRTSFVYDKGRLIEGLMREAEKNNVDVFTGVNAEAVEKTSAGVRVTGNGDAFEGAFVIAADGLNSRIANIMGFNKERKFYGAPPGVNYYLTGLSLPQPEAVTTPIFFKPNTPLPCFFWIIPSPHAEDEFWVAIRSLEDFEYAIKESVFSGWFKGCKVTRVRSYIWTQWSPVSEPYKDNVLLVGDAPWYAESEITGALMCGWKAANAISVALRDKRPDREGVLDYITWWQKSFPGYYDYRNMLMFLPLNLMFSAEELIYLYGLVQKPLLQTLNPFLIARLFKEAMEPMMSQIQREMPSAAEKLKMLEVDNIEKILLDIKNKKYKL